MRVKSCWVNDLRAGSKKSNVFVSHASILCFSLFQFLFLNLFFSLSLIYWERIAFKWGPPVCLPQDQCCHVRSFPAELSYFNMG